MASGPRLLMGHVVARPRFLSRVAAHCSMCARSHNAMRATRATGCGTGYFVLVPRASSVRNVLGVIPVMAAACVLVISSTIKAPALWLVVIALADCLRHNVQWRGHK